MNIESILKMSNSGESELMQMQDFLQNTSGVTVINNDDQSAPDDECNDNPKNLPSEICLSSSSEQTDVDFCEKCLERSNLGTLVDGLCEKCVSSSSSSPSIDDSEQSLTNPQTPPVPLHDITPTTCMCNREDDCVSKGTDAKLDW